MAAVSERPRCGPIGPCGYLVYLGFRLLAALAIAHPQLGFAVGTEMALQLMSLAKGVLGPIFFNLPSLDVLCGGGGL